MITKDGLRPDKEKVNAIQNFKAPESTKQLKSFLGMATYLGKFIPNLSNET